MAGNNIVTLTEENFSTEVLQSPTPVLVDFWGDHCPPCRALSPILDELADEFNGKVKFGKVNIGEQQGLAARFGIQAVPTMLLFRQGQVAEQIVGLKSKQSLKASFERLAA